MSLTAASPAVTEEQVYAALKQVIDPELGLNIVDLGLIYSLEIGPGGHVTVTMTLTTPACPLNASFPEWVEAALWQFVPGVSGVSVNVVWHPPWAPAMISPEGRALLGRS